jgi:DNA-binding NarL/FixJ family response regulator
MPPKPIRLVIVDDHPLFREGVVHTLQAQPDIIVVGEGGMAAAAPVLVRQHEPDILLLDIDMPGGGFSVLPEIAEIAPATRILFLTASIDDENVVMALRSGVCGYIVKGVTATELARIIRSVHAGHRYISPELAAHVLHDVIMTPRPAAADPDPLAALTERELQVLERVAAGANNREIANQLHLAEGTVKYYMSIVMQKMKVRNRVEAALLLRRLRGN